MSSDCLMDFFWNCNDQNKNFTRTVCRCATAIFQVIIHPNTTQKQTVHKTPLYIYVKYKTSTTQIITTLFPPVLLPFLPLQPFQFMQMHNVFLCFGQVWFFLVLMFPSVPVFVVLLWTKPTNYGRRWWGWGLLLLLLLLCWWWGWLGSGKRLCSFGSRSGGINGDFFFIVFNFTVFKVLVWGLGGGVLLVCWVTVEGEGKSLLITYISVLWKS